MQCFRSNPDSLWYYTLQGLKFWLIWLLNAWYSVYASFALQFLWLVWVHCPYSTILGRNRSLASTVISKRGHRNSNEHIKCTCWTSVYQVKGMSGIFVWRENQLTALNLNSSNLLSRKILMVLGLMSLRFHGQLPNDQRSLIDFIQVWLTLPKELKTCV